ncbi:MarR family transcriptional regulator [Streptomyces nojiriensis]|uniref:MarR family transcriptional regulator n=1 Tax=Streptomyces nojiriensis TaxID=66374 RepID=A0ABQ3SFH1_9ACTN|nr:MarR family transcriptional regulator [Streptomyces nojiriensis]QTI48533.1 HTH-type transcriptional repressor NicR [Streptomyces nojiriensis]GGS03471.1 MarR family transcriptional regulator [Streptomyces nojiriensis]GHI66891.1 MarR family transcriptional regulator [Streptomyces nojiriensis]
MTTEENGPLAVPARLRELPSRLLGQASTHAQRLVTEGLSGADARKWHYAALVALEESGPASQAALSARTGIHRSDLVAVINELAARELVERTPDPEDRRRNVITLTPPGRRQLRELEQILAAAQEELLAPLSTQEREQLVRLLGRIVDHHAHGDPVMGSDGR